MGNKIYLTIKVLSLIGLFLAGYLFWQQLFPSTFRPCTVNSTINCDAVISGAVSKTLGLPTPLYGLVGYIVIFVSAIWHKKKLLTFMSGFGLAFCLWIAYQELFLLHVVCPICIACQIIMITIFILTIKLLKLK